MPALPWVVHSLNLPQLGTARISIVEEWGPRWVLRKSGTLYGFKCCSCMQRFLRRAELHNSLYRLILGISHRDQPKKLKVELGEKMKSLQKKKKKKYVYINLKFWSRFLVEQTPLHFILGPILFLIQLWTECLAFFSLQPPKSPQNLEYCSYFRSYLQWHPMKVFYQMAKQRFIFYYSPGYSWKSRNISTLFFSDLFLRILMEEKY